MDKLPTEILHAVFLQLNLEERIKYMLVCRKWWRVLDEYSLLYNVIIDNNKEKLIRFIAMIKAMPHRAVQVQQFIVFDSIDHDFNKRELYNLFPNARIIKLIWHRQVKDLRERYISFNEPNTMVHFNSKIEVLADHMHCELAFQMLTSNLCSNLRELDLDFFTNPGTKRVILSQLRNLPALQKLSFASVRIGVEDLEMIHKNIPSIQNLYLRDVRLEASEMPSGILPVTALKDFYIDIRRTSEDTTHSQLYQYMTAKYVNVTNINYIDKLLSRLHSDVVEQIYQNGALDFLRMIGQKQNKMTICCTPNTFDIFAQLDAINAEIEELRIWDCINKQLYDLGRSNQSRFVRTLDIHHSYFEFGDSIATMSSLHTVNISNNFEYDDVNGAPVLNLVDCLNAFPESVTKFTTSGYTLKANRSMTRQSHIEILDISCFKLNQYIGQTISTCFPKLKELTLSGCLVQDIEIILNHPHLRDMKITTTSWNDYAFLLACGNQIEYFVRYYDSMRRKIEMRPVSLEEIENYPLLSITTSPDKKLNFSNEKIEIRSQ